MIAYNLCSGKTLFHANAEDNLDQDALVALHHWNSEYKESKLSQIKNPMARNFLYQLLYKDPLKRPSIKRVLSHPFLSGKKTTRLLGDEPLYDIFLSYRKASDLELASMIHDHLTNIGLNVFWDVKSIKSGERWEHSFCDGLANSRIFVPIISRNAINHPEIKNQNIAYLEEDSPCDNVLLEYQLALEFLEVGFVENICPIFIGDVIVDSNGKQSYGNYFEDACQPIQQGKGIIVKDIQTKFLEHIDRLALGSPMFTKFQVFDIFQQIKSFHGVLIEGEVLEICCQKISHHLSDIIHKHSRLLDIEEKVDKHANEYNKVMSNQELVSKDNDKENVKDYMIEQVETNNDISIEIPILHPSSPKNDDNNYNDNNSNINITNTREWEAEREHYLTEIQRKVDEIVIKDSTITDLQKEVINKQLSLQAKDSSLQQLQKEIIRIKLLYRHAMKRKGTSSRAASPEK